MNEEDIYDFNDRESYEENDDWFECQSCFALIKDPYVIKEFGMEWYLCPECGGECV